MIETERLLLRPFCGDDLDIIFRLYSDEEILRYMPVDCMDWEAAEKHLKKIVAEWNEEPRINGEMAIISKADGEKIGRCHIRLDEETDTAMIGWLLLQKDWGKGYATETTHALLDYCFRVLGVHRACALCHPDNAGSWRVLEKCGMRREAHYRQKCRYVKDGRAFWQDELEYAILAAERQT